MPEADGAAKLSDDNDWAVEARAIDGPECETEHGGMFRARGNNKRLFGLSCSADLRRPRRCNVGAMAAETARLIV